jgi:hypothetical protein
MKRFFALSVLIFMLITGMNSCSKDEGTGGNSSIYGKVMVKDYNSTFTVLQEEYYGPDIDVYIVYGDDKSYSDRTRTSYDGTYEFKYLRPGNYQVFAYSKDSSLQTNALIAVIKNVEIEKKKQEVAVDDIVVFD